LSIEIPYRYFQFEDIAFYNTTLDYFDAPMVIYKNATGPTPMCATSTPKRECDPKCFVCDDVAVTIDNRIAPVITPESTRVKIKAYEKIDMRISDDQGLGSTRYLFPQGTANGWIDVINLSYFPEGRSYMDIVRSLLLAQAGDCNGAYTMYKDRIEDAEGLDEYSQVRVLAMIGYLHGQQGGEISAVISDLESKIEDSATLRDKEKLQALVANYTELNLLNCPGN
jgi:hypothetical protein